MAQTNSFSLLQVIATSSITFIISGIGGALFQRWLSKSKPSISITSIGFEVPDELVELPESLQALSRQCGWTDNLKKYEESQDLINLHLETQTIAEKLSKALESAQQWLQNHEGISVELIMTPAEVKKHPLFQGESNTVGSLLVGGIMRSEVSDPPINLEGEVGAYKDIFQVKEAEDQYFIYLGDREVKFPFKGMYEQQRTQVSVLWQSFSKGIYRNMAHYTREFISSARSVEC